MGNEIIAKCAKCGTTFKVREGGGFKFHLLHCDECGTEKRIKLDKLGEIHTRYVKGLHMPYSSVSVSEDSYIQKHYSGSSITTDQYHLEIERIAGKCSCGGLLKIDAKAKCPKCHSDDYKDTGEWGVDYD